MSQVGLAHTVRVAATLFSRGGFLEKITPQYKGHCLVGSHQRVYEGGLLFWKGVINNHDSITGLAEEGKQRERT